MGWRIVVLSGLIGCHGGIDVEVNAGTTGADHVELFLGTGPCIAPDCHGVVGPRAIGLPGDLHYLDGAAPLVACADPKTHVATFRLEPDVPHVFVLIAVGVMTGTADNCATPVATSDTIVGAAKINDLDPGKGPEVDKVTLQPVVPLTAPASQGGPRVDLWREMNAPNAACVAFEQDLAGTPDIELVVPDGDPDCDDVPNAQELCVGGRDYYHLAAPPSSLSPSEIRCTIAPTATTPCYLGGGCSDGMTGACNGGNYCAPDATCNPGCITPMPGDQCFPIRRPGTTALATEIFCTAPVTVTAGNTFQACPGTSTARVDIAPPGVGPLTCNAVSFLGYPAVTLDEFHSTATLSPWQLSTSGAPSCDVVVDFGPAGIVGPAPKQGLVQLARPSADPTKPDVHLVLPIVLGYRPTSNCGSEEVTCVASYSPGTLQPEHLWSCGQ